MIKEILLSLAVAAASGVSFVGSPKRSITPEGYGAPYGVQISYDNLPNRPFSGFFFSDYSSNQFNDVSSDALNTSYFLPLNSGGTQEARYSADCYWSIENSICNFTTELFYYLDIRSYQDGLDYLETLHAEARSGEGNITPTVSNHEITDSYEEDGEWFVNIAISAEINLSNATQGETFTIGLYEPETYQITKSFVNCDIASSPRLPDSFTSSSQLTYYVLMVANAGGYGFTAQSVTQTGGITIRNFNLFDQYNNSGYYASCSFNVDLPLNNCSLSVTASLPQYTINSTLEHCTVSPALPSSYTGTSFSGDYTFTAVSGYGFNKNYTHWEVTNLFIDRVDFSSLLWGSFYSSVTLHLRASGGNSSISVTAIKYDEESYKLGYDEGRADGWQAGYDRGHADGEIAGNSYGVWNWLKQAATTTGEFLSIPLLPGFSIGGLLTALAGLVIIWFFIKGFLFKS